jgi:hypothetical protein
MCGLNLSIRLMNTRVPKFFAFTADFGNLTGMGIPGTFWATSSGPITDSGSANKIFFDIDEKITVSITITQNIGSDTMPSSSRYIINGSSPITYSTPFAVTYGDVISIGAVVSGGLLSGTGNITVRNSATSQIIDTIPWTIN